MPNYWNVLNIHILSQVANSISELQDHKEKKKKGVNI